MTDLQIDDRDHVRTITIDRPGSRNALTTELPPPGQRDELVSGNL